MTKANVRDEAGLIGSFDKKELMNYSSLYKSYHIEYIGKEKKK